MIRTEREYQEALRRFQEDEQHIAAEHDALVARGYSVEEIKNLLDPVRAFHVQLHDTIRWYEHVKQGNFEPIRRLPDIGRLLIGVRIWRGLSQADLARTLGVDESLVSRDERNEYHGITLDRAQRILDAMMTETVTGVQKATEEVATPA